MLFFCALNSLPQLPHLAEAYSICSLSLEITSLQRPSLTAYDWAMYPSHRLSNLPCTYYDNFCHIVPQTPLYLSVSFIRLEVY